MFGDALSYPIRGAWLERAVVGSLLVLGSPLVVPLLVLVGYCVRVLGTSIEGAEEPPPFDDWSALVRTGGVGTAITLAYLLAPLAVAGLLAALLLVGGRYGLAGIAPHLGGRPAIVWGVSVVAAALAGLVSLAVVGGTLLVYYLLPAALARYAATGRVGAAFDRTALTSIATSGEYFLAMAAVQLVPLVVPVVALAGLLTVVGVVALPALPFLAAVLVARLVGRGVARADGSSGRLAGHRDLPVDRIE